MVFIRVVSIQYKFIIPFFLNSILKEASLFIFKTINFTRITVILVENVHTNKIVEIEIRTSSRFNTFSIKIDPIEFYLLCDFDQNDKTSE